MRKWEKVDILLTNEERQSFKSALIIFAIIEALVFIPYMVYTMLH